MKTRIKYKDIKFEVWNILKSGYYVKWPYIDIQIEKSYHNKYEDAVKFAKEQINKIQ